MYTDKIELSFEAGHRLLHYGGKCEAPHGHSYKAEILVASEKLDELGFVTDFVRLKDEVGQWIDQNWDHAFLVNSEDMELLKAFNLLTTKKTFVFEKTNPSAENIAHRLYTQVRLLYGDTAYKVRIWESATDCAEYSERG